MWKETADHNMVRSIMRISYEFYLYVNNNNYTNSRENQIGNKRISSLGKSNSPRRGIYVSRIYQIQDSMKMDYNRK